MIHQRTHFQSLLSLFHNTRYVHQVCAIISTYQANLIDMQPEMNLYNLYNHPALIHIQGQGQGSLYHPQLVLLLSFSYQARQILWQHCETVQRHDQHLDEER